jgi:hypothetical protein
MNKSVLAYAEWLYVNFKMVDVKIRIQSEALVPLLTPLKTRRTVPLKGLSHEIFGPVFWAVWMYLDLNVNRLWFFNFNDAPLILDNYFKF